MEMQNVTDLMRAALAEDLGDAGDVTTLATVLADSVGQARIVAKANGVLAGSFVVEQVFNLVNPQLKVDVLLEDGNLVEPGQDVITIQGSQRSILTGERTALNFLCHLSGVASLTAQFVKAVDGPKARILDTRKTNPGMRSLEKYAVRMGGGFNHRSGLFDMILIKENHIAAAGGLTLAVQRCHEYLKEHKLSRKIEIETQTLAEVEQAMSQGVDRIMLDNMNVDTIKKAASLVNGQVELEVSGRVNLESVRALAKTGVDFISIGRLTHSPDALDLSLLIN